MGPIFSIIDHNGEINDLNRSINNIQNNINNLNYNIFVQQTKINNLQNDKNKYLNDINNEKRTLTLLTSERDQKLIILAELKTILNRLENSIVLANKSSDTTIKQVNSLKDSYLKTKLDDLNTQKKIYYEIRKQNNFLTGSSKKIDKIYRTNDQKTGFQLEKTEYLQYVNFYLLLIYFLLVFIFCYFLFRNSMNIYLKVICFVFIFIYPFVIIYIELLVFYIIKSLYKYLEIIDK
jgi:chromosome segregation ATPase